MACICRLQVLVTWAWAVIWPALGRGRTDRWGKGRLEDCHPGRFLSWCWVLVENVKQVLTKSTGGIVSFWTLEPTQSILRWGSTPSAYTWFPDNALKMGYWASRASPGCLLASAGGTARSQSLGLILGGQGIAHYWLPLVVNFYQG